MRVSSVGHFRRISGCVLSWLLLLPVLAGTDAPADVLATLRPSHPRLLATSNDWAALQLRGAQDPTLQRLCARVQADACQLLDKPPLAYEKQGRRLLAVSRAALVRISALAFSYRLSSDARFAQRAEREMLALAAFKDWNPSHFLDTAEMTAALAIGYDWLYAELSPAARATIRRAIVEKGLQEAIGPAAKYTSWRRTENNWNQVCFGGLTLGALAVGDEEPQAARALLEAARRENINGLKPYAPAGVYPEGPGYWSYGTTYQVLMLAALQSALGDTWGLENATGFLASAAGQVQQTGPTSLAFNFSDGGEVVRVRPAMFWFARRLRQPALLPQQLQAVEQMLAQPADSDGFLPFLALWWEQPVAGQVASELPLAWFGEGPNPIGVFRSSWVDRNALFLAFKGGSAALNHAHMDAGSFVMDLDGVRWVSDLGAQDYYSIESKGWNLWDRSPTGQRWQVYRLNNFSHSTLTIAGKLHQVNGAAQITTFDAKAQEATVDLSKIFAGDARRVTRHFGVNSQRQVRIRDELEGLKPGVNVRWQLVTRTRVEANGARAILKQSGKSLTAQLVVPAGNRFQVAPANPPQDGVNEGNPHTSLLALDVVAPQDGRLTIEVLLSPGSPAPP